MPATTIWLQWSADPAFTLTCIVVVLWLLGGRGTHRRTSPAWRTAAFWSGIAVIVLALNSPLDIEASRLFWVHMVQHVLLLTVAAPLLVLSRPLPRLLRGLPRRERLSLVHWVRHGRAAGPLRWIARPWPAWCAFCAGLLLWHIPALYDFALRHDPVHDLEHITYLATGLLFWEHALASPPFRTSMDWLGRAVYTTSAMTVGWLLAVALALAPRPLYSYYARLAVRPGHISALADQQIAAGVMWVPGSLALTLAAAYAMYRWLEPAPAVRVTRSGLRSGGPAAAGHVAGSGTPTPAP